MAHLGHDVIALDTNAEKIAMLQSGQVPFHEPGLTELLEDTLKSGRLTFTTSFADVAANADIHFVCVGTPQQVDSNAANMSQVNSAVAQLAEHLASPAIVVGKSTVPVGTAQRLHSELVSKSPAGSGVHLVWNPEFLREGFAVQDTLHPDRIVLGVTSSEDAQRVADVYAAAIDEGTPVVVTDYATAELVKVAANAFLATKISFINAFADLADATGADITQLADAIGHDTRIGRRFLNAGVGFGGGCLPKDIRALQARATELGLADTFEFLTHIDAINQSRRDTIVERAVIALDGSLHGKTVTVLGAAFKPDSDDIRDSPALHIAQELADAGAIVKIHDPAALPVLSTKTHNLQLCEDLESAFDNSDLVLHLTEWKEYRALDPNALGDRVKSRIIIDGRNVLDRDLWSSAGWSISYLGRPGS